MPCNFKNVLKPTVINVTTGPKTETFLHVSGARMEQGKLIIVDNTGLLDPRLRKILAVAGTVGIKYKTLTDVTGNASDPHSFLANLLSNFLSLCRSEARIPHLK